MALEDQIKLIRESLPLRRREIFDYISREYLIVKHAGIDPVAARLLPGVTTDELLSLAIDMLKATSIFSAYDILARRSPAQNETYYDLLVGNVVLMPMYQAVDLAFRSHEQAKVEKGLDVATGTGMGAKILSQRVNHVCAVDISDPLLAVADTNLHNLITGNPGRYAERYEVMRMDALHLSGFDDETFDIAMSIGFSNFLTQKERTTFYGNIHRILRRGGRYYEPQTVSRSFQSSCPMISFAHDVGGIPAYLNQERLGVETTRGFPNLAMMGFRNVPVEPKIPNVGVMLLQKT